MDETVSASPLSDWGQWAQQQAGSLIGGVMNMWQYRTIANNGGVPAVTPSGQVYTEGKRIPGVSVSNGAVTISPLMLAAGVVLLVLIAKK